MTPGDTPTCSPLDVEALSGWTLFLNLTGPTGGPRTHALTVKPLSNWGWQGATTRHAISPYAYALVTNDKRVIQILLDHGVLDKEHVGIALHKFALYKEEAEIALECNGNTVYECSFEHSLQIGTFQQAYYENAELRVSMYDEAVVLETQVLKDHDPRISTGGGFERDKSDKRM